MALSRLTLKQRIVVAAFGAAILGTIAAPSNAADLGLGHRHRVKHVWTSRHYGNWRDRCAYAGYYCLYAEYRFVYSYPYDDRPVAHGHRRFYR